MGKKQTGRLAERPGNLDHTTTTEIGFYMKNSNTELENFKRNIDLVQYAEKCGYTVDQRKSSKNNTNVLSPSLWESAFGFP